MPGATDGTILWRDAGVPIVTYGPGDKWIAHQVDEHVEVEDLARSAEVYVEAASIFLGGQGDPSGRPGSAGRGGFLPSPPTAD